MKPAWKLVLLGVVAAAAAHAAPVTTPPPSRPAVPPAAVAAGPTRLRSVTLHVFHRVFTSFHDKVEAKLRQDFRIGDTEYTGRLVEFVPDFAMDLKTRKVISRTQEPRNPGFRLIVRKNGVPQDTCWAFVNMPPHFARKSLVAFIATRVDFENRPPVVSQDSLALRLMQRDKETAR